MTLTKAHSRMIKGVPVNIFDFGAVGDGATDDSAAVQAAANYCVANGEALYAPAGYEIYLASAIDLRSIKYIQFNADILVDPSIVDVPVTVGGLAQQIGGRWEFNRVSDGSSFLVGTPPSRPVFRIAGSKSVHIEIGSCQYVQLYSDASVTNGTSNAYNSIYLHGAVYKMEFFGASGVSWVNENFIYGGRLKKLIVDGTNYGHNHNKFFNNTFEGADVDIQFLGDAHVNSIYGARFEGADASSGITFGSGSYSNYVIQSWSGTGNPRPQFEVAIPVSDSGQGNAVFTEASHLFQTVPVLSIGQSNIILGTSSDSFVDSIWCDQPFGVYSAQGWVTPELRGFTPVFPIRYIALTDYIPVQRGDVFQQSATYNGNLTRLHIYVFDEDMRPLASGDHIFAPGYSYVFSGGFGYYERGTNASASGLTDFSVISDQCRYVKIGLYAPVAGLIENYEISLFTPPSKRGLSKSFADRRLSVGVLNGTPTKGYAPLGYMIYETTGGTFKRVTYAHETQVSGALSAGATTVSVASIGSVANGDVVGIILDDDTTHWTTVSGLSGSAFGIDAIPAGRSVSNGARIVFNRWA